MRAVRCVEGAVAVVDSPEPSGEGVRVKVASVGICGSDFHLLGWNLPVVMGHEFAGTLDDGTPVAAEPLAPCGTCEYCRAGDYNYCLLGPGMVLGVAHDGAMAESCLVPASAVVRLASGLSTSDACLVEPLAVAVHAVRRGRIGARDRVAVIGGGSIGQMAVVATSCAGATVDLEARHEHQREVGAKLGAGPVSGDYDIVIEAAGNTTALARAVELCRPGGRVVLVGTYWDSVELPGQALTMKEVDLVPASMYSIVGPSRDFEVAATILSYRQDVPAAVITHRFPLDAAPEAFAVAADRAAGAIKVVLEP